MVGKFQLESANVDSVGALYSICIDQQWNCKNIKGNHTKMHQG